MKKRIICMLLCISMTFSAFGCGSKETASDKAIVEKEENETPEEATEEVVEENVENETTSTEEVVEEIFVESEWKNENIKYGETEYTSFGYYTVLGPLEENPNLEKYEIGIDNHIFKVVLPKDMGDSVEYNEENHLVNFFNKDASKVAGIAYTEGAFNTGTAVGFCEYIMSEVGADTTNEEIIILDEKTLKAYQFGKSETWENLAYLGVWDIGEEKIYEGKEYQNVGYNYRFFYGENTGAFNRETVKTIMESFTLLSNEDVN